MKEHYIYKKKDLIQGINRIKQYPIVQIYSALNQLINDKNEYITDMLGRIGHLINIGDYYMFQPIELENKHITRYERTHPIEYKRDRLIIRLPEKIPKSYIEEEIDIKRIIGEMREKLENVQIPKALARGENDWYNYCSLTFIRLKEYIPEGELLKYILHHIIDCEYLYKKQLINYIYYSQLTPFEIKIKEYLDTFIIEKNGVKAILYYSPQSEKPVKISVFDQTEVREILPTEIRSLGFNKGPEHWARPPLNIDQINDFVGFMLLFDKSEKIMFKIKEMRKKRNKGARCDQMPKKNIKPILNKIKGDRLYSELILDQEVPGEKKKKKISGGQFCCELELILRYYDDIGEKGMRWFLSTVDIKLNQIETKTKN